MPGHYKPRVFKKTGMNKKMTMTKAVTKGKAVPKKGTPAMKKQMAQLRSLKGKK